MSVRPVFNAITGTRSVSRSTASTSRRPSSTPSIASATAATLSSPARWSSTSANPTSTAFPRPTPSRMPRPSPSARKASAWLTPPLCATIASDPGRRLAAGRTKLAHSRAGGLRKPDVFGPRMRRPVSRASVAELGLEALAVGACLGPAARVDDGCADPGLRALAQNGSHGLRRDGQQGEVDGVGDIRDARIPGPTRDLLPARVHGHDGSRERLEAVHQHVAGLAGSRRRADDGDDARVEERGERARPASDDRHRRGYPAPSSAPRTSSGSTLVGRRSSNRSRVRTQ